MVFCTQVLASLDLLLDSDKGTYLRHGHQWLVILPTILGRSE